MRWASAGAFGLIVIFLFAACATRAPRAVRSGGEDIPLLDVVVMEPGRVRTRPVLTTKAEFQEDIARLAHGRQVQGSPQAVAAAMFELQGLLQQAGELKPVSDLEGAGRFTGEWDPRADGGRGRMNALLPEEQWGPVRLEPRAETELRVRYEHFCLARGGGDCLGLFEDGPYLRSDDRSTLAMALAFGAVLDETYAALKHELNPRVLLASIVWTASIYLGLWLLPEPVTKGVAAVLTVALVAWLGIDTVWSLMDGWAELVMKARVATTFTMKSCLGRTGTSSFTGGGWRASSFV